jgi:hypothetical protein
LWCHCTAQRNQLWHVTLLLKGLDRMSKLEDKRTGVTHVTHAMLISLLSLALGDTSPVCYVYSSANPMLRPL